MNLTGPVVPLAHTWLAPRNRPRSPIGASCHLPAMCPFTCHFGVDATQVASLGRDRHQERNFWLWPAAPSAAAVQQGEPEHGVLDCLLPLKIHQAYCARAVCTVSQYAGTWIPRPERPSGTDAESMRGNVY